MEIPNDRFSLVRIKATGQVTELTPAKARAMVGSGMAELIDRSNGEIVETASIEPAFERAVTPEQNAKPKKPKTRSAR